MKKIFIIMLLPQLAHAAELERLLTPGSINDDGGATYVRTQRSPEMDSASLCSSTGLSLAEDHDIGKLVAYAESLRFGRQCGSGPAILESLAWLRMAVALEGADSSNDWRAHSAFHQALMPGGGVFNSQHEKALRNYRVQFQEGVDRHNRQLQQHDKVLLDVLDGTGTRMAKDYLELARKLDKEGDPCAALAVLCTVQARFPSVGVLTNELSFFYSREKNLYENKLFSPQRLEALRFAQQTVRLQPCMATYDTLAQVYEEADRGLADGARASKVPAHKGRESEMKQRALAAYERALDFDGKELGDKVSAKRKFIARKIATLSKELSTRER